MTRLIILDRGEELSDASWEALDPRKAPVRLKLLEPTPPFLAADIVHVTPLDEGQARLRDLLLFRCDGGFRFGPRLHGPTPEAAEPLGRVTSIERGAVSFSLQKGILSYVPRRWLSRAVDVLELRWRLRHPLTPPLFLGSTDACLGGIREKYNHPVEAHEYSRLTGTGLHPIEREILERHLKPGGRLLDIGCGAGREALGLVRAGFRVLGIDIASRMIEAARANAQREGLRATFRVRSATDLDEPPDSFDGAYWAGSYHHVPGRALRIEALRRIMRALTRDGALILMVVYRERRSLLSRSRLVDLLRKALRRLPGPWRFSEPGDGYMREISEASDPQAPCFFHEFATPGEVRAEIEAAGLSAEEVAPDWWICRKPLP